MSRVTLNDMIDARASAPAFSSIYPSKTVLNRKFVDIQDMAGADPTGATVSDTALLAAETVLTAAGGGVLLLSAGTWKFTASAFSPKTNIHYLGLGQGVTTLKGTGSILCYCDSGAYWSVENLTVDGAGVLNVAFSIFYAGGWAIRRVEIKDLTTGASGYGIKVTSANDWLIDEPYMHCAANTDYPMIGIQTEGGCKDWRIRKPKMRWVRSGILMNGGGGGSYDTDVQENWAIEDPDLDLGWLIRPPRYSRSGAGVSYTAGVLTDTGASFAASLTVGSTVRIMKELVASATSAAWPSTNPTQLTCAGATFVTAGVQEGDWVVSGTTFGVVANVESQTVLGVEGWLDRTTLGAAGAPQAASFTIVHPIYGYLTGNTATTASVSRWHDLTGVSVTVIAAGTPYEICYAPTSHPIAGEAGVRRGKIRGGIVKRGWGDQIALWGSDNLVSDVDIEWGQDVGLGFEAGLGNVASNVRVRGQGAWGILGVPGSLIDNCVVTDTPYVNNTVNGAPIALYAADHAVVRGGRVEAGRSVLCNKAVYIVTSSYAIDAVTIDGLDCRGTTTVVALNAAGGNITGTEIINPKMTAGMTPYTIIAAGFTADVPSYGRVGTIKLYAGSGAPAGSMGVVDDEYHRIGGGAATSIYKKTGASTWTAIA